MTLTTHAAVGMLVTQWTDSILIGFLFALTSHYLTDAIPHGDEFLYWRYVHNPKDAVALLAASADTFALILLLLTVVNYASPFNQTMLVAGVIGGVLPDLLMSLYTKQYGPIGAPAEDPTKRKNLFQRFLAAHFSLHMFFHNTMRIPIRFRTAITYQAAFLAAFVYFFIFT
jgi:hypothetical protein